MSKSLLQNSESSYFCKPNWRKSDLKLEEWQSGRPDSYRGAAVSKARQLEEWQSGRLRRS